MLEVPSGVMVAPDFLWLPTFSFVKVPDDYEHENRLKRFRHLATNRLAVFNMLLTDELCNRPSYILKSGERLFLSFFEWIPAETPNLTAERCLEFLRGQKVSPIFPMAQGLSLVVEQRRDKLLKGFVHLTVDELDRLPKDPNGVSRVPGIRFYEDGSQGLDLESAKQCLSRKVILLGFTKRPLCP